MSVEKLYLEKFYPGEHEKKGKEALVKIWKNKQFLTRQAVKLGFFLGIFVACFFSTILILFEVDFFNDT